jgi:hypothetical protein
MPRSFVSTVAHSAQIWQRLLHPPRNLCSNRFSFQLRVRRGLLAASARDLALSLASPPMPSATVLPPPPSREMRPYPARTISAPAPLFLHLTPAPTQLSRAFCRRLRLAHSTWIEFRQRSRILGIRERLAKPVAGRCAGRWGPAQSRYTCGYKSITAFAAQRTSGGHEAPVWRTFPECVTLNTTRVRYRVIFLSYACFLS